MQWICAAAQERAQAYGIQGVTYNLTMGVVKNIIPAIASTNALVSAACVNEVIKIMTGCNKVLNNYMQFMGQTGVSTHTYVSERKPDCLVCGAIRHVKATFSKTAKLSEVLDKIKENEKLQRPAYNADEETLYMSHPEQMEAMHHHKLDMTIADLMDKKIISKSNKQVW